MLVNFVVGGTQKGGTSALDLFLRQHGEICMPRTKKELHYFDREEHFYKRPNYKKYHAYFQPEPQHRVIGEATPSYMYWSAAPYRIWSYNPQMKWILVLRNPVERAFSAWNMETKRGAEDLSFAEAVEREATRCREALPRQHRVFSYVDRGFYAHQVRRLFNIFGADNLLILLTEDLRRDHHETLRKVFAFLQVDSGFTAPEASVFGQDYDQQIDPELYSRLMERFYYDIKQLERLLQRDLSAWHATKTQAL
jgi:sulfotransferase family protein